jgi:hypothetical protein
MINQVGLHQQKGSPNVEFLEGNSRNIMPDKPIELKESDVLGTLKIPEDKDKSATLVYPQKNDLVDDEGNLKKKFPIPIGDDIQFNFPQNKEADNSFFKSRREKIIFFAFIIPPLAISLISMMHLISLFATSNSYAMAVAISVSIELASMSSLVALVTLNKLNKFTIWSIFFVLSALQVIGNMYHAYVNTTPESLKSILDLLALSTSPWSLRFVMFMVSGILPVISLTFIKGIVDYFKD